jgi:cytoskeletal protein CcmA (bactofilin family)
MALTLSQTPGGINIRNADNELLLPVFFHRALAGKEEKTGRLALNGPKKIEENPSCNHQLQLTIIPAAPIIRPAIGGRWGKEATMSIFDPKDKKDEAEAGLPPGAASVGPTHFINGQVTGEEDLVIKGYIKGRVDLKDHNLFIEKGGRVDGDIIVKDLVLRGLVNGNIFATGKVYVAPEAHVRGDISAARISISDGAIFKGSIKMEEDMETVSAPREKSESAGARDLKKP